MVMSRRIGIIGVLFVLIVISGWAQFPGSSSPLVIKQRSRASVIIDPQISYASRCVFKSDFDSPVGQQTFDTWTNGFGLRWWTMTGIAWSNESMSGASSGCLFLQGVRDASGSQFIPPGFELGTGFTNWLSQATNWTFMCRMKTTADGADHCLVNVENMSPLGTYYQVSVHWGGNSLQSVMQRDGVNKWICNSGSGSLTPASGQWIHIGVVYTNGSQFYYTNGVALTTTYTTTTDTNVTLATLFTGSTYPFRIFDVGAYIYDGSAGYRWSGGPGYWDDLGFWIRALSQTEIRQTATNQTLVPKDGSLVCLYDWVTADSLTVTDESVAGHNATLDTYVPLWRNGKYFFYYNQSMHLDDHDDFTFAAGVPFTIVIDYEDMGADTAMGASILGKVNASGWEWALRRWPEHNNVDFTMNDSVSGGFRGRQTVYGSIVNITPYQIVVTHDGSALSAGCKIYVNGVSSDGGTAEGGSFVTMRNSAYPVYLGYAQNGVHVTLLCGKAHIYRNVAWSANEVLLHYNLHHPQL